MSPARPRVGAVVAAAAMLGALLVARPGPAWGADSAVPPSQATKLVFIHHSVGQNWLDDSQGGLGQSLAANSYFASDTNYGWGPGSIGDRTDIPDWIEWFSSAGTPSYMSAVFSESAANSPFSRPLADPGGENEIVMFKSCFPNSSLDGNPGDGPTSQPGMTVGHAKYVYNQVLQYFATRPDKLFILVTAPPNNDAGRAANARALNEWLMGTWLSGYGGSNVAVFDFYNVLTGPANHHRWINGNVEHTYVPGMNTSYYPSAPDDDHPNASGSQKATTEFVSLLNVFHNRWRAGTPGPTPSPAPSPSPSPSPSPTTGPSPGSPGSPPGTSQSCRRFSAKYRGVRASIKACTTGRWTQKKIKAAKKQARAAAVRKWRKTHKQR